MSEQDDGSLWRVAVDHHLPDPLASEAHGAIDGSHGFESLEQEQRTLASGATGKSLVVQFVKARAPTPDQRYLQIEVQAQPAEGFGHLPVLSAPRGARATL
jgi:hypothetical protein